MLCLPATLTQVQATACLAELSALLNAQGPQVVVEAAALHEFDSAALAVLLELRRGALDAGKQFAVHSMPPRLANLATLYGIETLLPAA
jgi:phospholipid transport system transporter-binding protein